MGVLKKLFRRGVSHGDLNRYRASIRDRHRVRIVEITAGDQSHARQKLAKRYGEAAIEWLHETAD